MQAIGERAARTSRYANCSIQGRSCSDARFGKTHVGSFEQTLKIANVRAISARKTVKMRCVYRLKKLVGADGGHAGYTALKKRLAVS
jgi:hypothetical protein